MASTSSPVTPSLCVLVVEDDDDSREMLTELIGSLGYETRSAGNCEQALAVAEDGAWDIALIDLGLPQVDGCEVARLLRARERDRRRFLVALTGYSDAATRATAREVGFDDFLVKPVFPEKLAEILARVVSG